MSAVDSNSQLSILKRGTVDLQVENELVEKLNSGKSLRVKAGFDPTRPDLHLGHAVLLTKLRQFQDLGHTVVFVVGDFTAQIGDPSGKSATRPILTREEIDEGAKTYADQAFKILDKERTDLVYNQSWLGAMNFADVIKLAGKYTLARMMERDDFKKRWTEHQSISVHELLYPLAQAYDSVELECDVELGGTDQLFNLLVGRDLMREYGKAPQVVMTTPILEGLNAREVDGKIVGDKMSKSLDNYVGIDEPPLEQFGKLMSIGDAVMWRYYALLSQLDESEIAERKRACENNVLNPKQAKAWLAKELITRFHDAESADEAEKSWEAQFSKKKVPEEMPHVVIEASASEVWLAKVLAEASLVKSSSEGKRRIEQGAVEVDGERVDDAKAFLKAGATYTVRAGKRAWAKIQILKP